MITSNPSDPFSFKFNETNYETYDVEPYDLTHDYAFKLTEPIEYAFNEDALLDEMQSYIDSTYDAHYSQDKYQSTQIIEDMGHGMGFALGNVIKYCQRYGKKDGFNRNDLKKVIHYGIIALAMHDKEHQD